MRSKSVNSSRCAARQRRAKRGCCAPRGAQRTRRCRDWTGAAYIRSDIVREIRTGHGQGTVRTTNGIDPAAKAEVVRKSAARKSVRVRAPVIPYATAVPVRRFDGARLLRRVQLREGDKRISSLDENGSALAAIKALHAKEAESQCAHDRRVDAELALPRRYSLRSPRSPWPCGASCSACCLRSAVSDRPTST